MRDQVKPLEGFVVEDCAVPAALSSLMFPMLEFLPDPVRPVYSAAQRVAKFAARVGGKVFGAYFACGSVAKTAVYLIMSHDSKLQSTKRKASRSLIFF
jgi:hypothetical protein